MSNHADNLHIGGAAIGASLVGLIMTNDAVRRQARLEAEAEANSVRSVRALGMELAASLRREAAMKEEIIKLRFELGRARGEIRRAAARPASC